jgi:hypothetical protein
VSDERLLLQAAYARATGLKYSTVTSAGNVPGVFGQDLNEIVQSVAQVIGDVARSFAMPPNAIWRSGSDDSDTYCDSRVVLAKLNQFISYLEQVHHVGSEIIEIGSLYNSIKDDELKNRCSDLLSATGHFDRVINQATLVLEDRIRTKSGIDKPLTGVQLVNVVLNADLGKTILRISEVAEEHEGVCHICRGVMLTFRNPTHHYVTDAYSREDALKVCAFIDNLLTAIDNAAIPTKKA